MERVPVWLDCDPGHDDAFAILLAALHPAFDLLGISTIHGNSSLEKVTNNALSLLTAFGRSEMPVYPGARKPFMRPAVHAPGIHGTTGIDGTDLLPTSLYKPQTTAAPEAMRNAIMATAPGTCALVVTGTMTNAALMFATYPETAEHIKVLSIMGGGFDVTNITTAAEFNIYCDPESASSIFTLPALSGKILLAPLDLTHTVLVTSSVRATLMSKPTQFRKMLHDLLMYFAGTYERKFNMTEGPPLHDPVAMVAVIPELCGLEFEEGGIEIVLQGEEMGRTVFVKEGAGENKHDGRQVLMDKDEGREGMGKVKVKVGRRVDVEKFWKVVMEVVEEADSRSPLNV